MCLTHAIKSYWMLYHDSTRYILTDSLSIFAKTSLQTLDRGLKTLLNMDMNFTNNTKTAILLRSPTHIRWYEMFIFFITYMVAQSYQKLIFNFTNLSVKRDCHKIFFSQSKNFVLLQRKWGWHRYKKKPNNFLFIYFLIR